MDELFLVQEGLGLCPTFALQLLKTSGSYCFFSLSSVLPVAVPCSHGCVFCTAGDLRLRVEWYSTIECCRLKKGCISPLLCNHTLDFKTTVHQSATGIVFPHVLSLRLLEKAVYLFLLLCACLRHCTSFLAGRPLLRRGPPTGLLTLYEFSPLCHIFCLQRTTFLV